MHISIAPSLIQPCGRRQPLGLNIIGNAVIVAIAGLVKVHQLPENDAGITTHLIGLALTRDERLNAILSRNDSIPDITPQ